MTESVEHLIVGAGPAGLRAAEVLGSAGREVLVVERHAIVGPKVCAGGLTQRSVREIGGLSGTDGTPLSPPVPSLASVTHVSLHASEALIPLSGECATVHTVSRRALGGWQLARAQRAGAEVRTGVAVSGFDLPARTARVGGTSIRYRHLIGADGADSGVRRALGLPSPRALFAGEFNVPGRRAEPLCVLCDTEQLANGYWWVFPHVDYTSIGAIAPKHLVPPARLRRMVERTAAGRGVPIADVPFEGATLEVEYCGVHFAHGVHLVGDAAGLPSALTGEGIYAALVSGEEVACSILEPAFPNPKLRKWLHTKRTHAICLAIVAGRRARAAMHWAIRAAMGRPSGRRVVTRLLTTG